MVAIGSIYTITNLLNGKRYVGFTSRNPADRFRCHQSGRSGCKALRDAFAKYGPNAMVFDVIYQSLDVRYALTEMEPHFISEFGTFGEGGYNLTAGGEGTLGRKRPPEEVRQMSLRSRGRKASPEARERMSQAQKRRPKGAAHQNFGRKRSAESIRKQVQNSVGKSRSLETRLKQSRAQQGASGSGFGKVGGLHPCAKRYRLERANGTAEEFSGLAAFCRLHPHYSASALSEIVHGKRFDYKDIVAVIELPHDQPVDLFSGGAA